jgi:hypothetical protein
LDSTTVDRTLNTLGSARGILAGGMADETRRSAPGPSAQAPLVLERSSTAPGHSRSRPRTGLTPAQFSAREGSFEIQGATWWWNTSNGDAFCALPQPAWRRSLVFLVFCGRRGFSGIRMGRRTIALGDRQRKGPKHYRYQDPIAMKVLMFWVCEHNLKFPAPAREHQPANLTCPLAAGSCVPVRTLTASAVNEMPPRLCGPI